MDHSVSNRLTVTNLAGDDHTQDRPGEDVVKGLQASPQKWLPPKYFYDERGSQLFEEICELPEYYPTRTERAILEQCGDAIAQLTGPCEIAELGSGSSSKTRILLTAYQSAGLPLRYLPIDVSDTMLVATARQLFQEYPDLAIHAFAGTYSPALDALPTKVLPHRMIAFIGSTLGNLGPDECDRFLRHISRTLTVGDFFLLGVDLQKETSILEAAYNDAAGITAQFNLNMLQHLNHRFAGNFDAEKFVHVARYNTERSQIEMHLKSLEAQTVELEKLNLTVTLAPGETILTEISRKFDLDDLAQQLQAKGLPVLQTFTDGQQWFGLLFCQKQS